MIITADVLITFALVFSRLAMMITMSPGFSTKEIPSMGKLILMFWISTLLIFYIPLPEMLPATPMLFIFAMIVEALIGMMMGFLAQILLIGIEFAGSLMDTQAGLSVASQLDPSTGQTTTLLSKTMKQIALIVFLLIDGHHVLLSMVVRSFTAVPIVPGLPNIKALDFVIETSIQIFSIALQLSAPILLVVFLIDFGFGMLSRVAPQVNVFQLGFQLKPLLSVLVFLTIIPGMVDMIYYILEKISSNLLTTLFILRAG